MSGNYIETTNPYRCIRFDPHWVAFINLIGRTKRSIIAVSRPIGGDLPGADFEQFLAQFTAARPWLPAPLARRYARAYGTRVERFVGGAGLEALGEHLGDGLYEAEIDYLIRNEWALTAEDILWRRSKLGLHVSKETRDRLSDWLERQRTAAGSQAAVS